MTYFSIGVEGGARRHILGDVHYTPLHDATMLFVSNLFVLHKRLVSSDVSVLGTDRGHEYCM